MKGVSGMVERDQYFKFQRNEMKTFLPDRYSTILEIGCGEGEFSFHLKERCELWGIEPDKESVGVSARKFKTVLHGTYDAVVSQIPDGYFDLVICNDVIEHMPDHDWFFDSIRKKMREDGRLVGSIPNVLYVRNLFNLLVRKDWRYEDSGILDRTHLRFFTRKSLLRTFQRWGFIVEKFEGINSPISRFKRFFVVFLSALSLGHFSESRYLQFGFRIRKGPGKSDN